MEHMHENHTEASTKGSSKKTLVSYDRSIASCGTASVELFQPQISTKKSFKTYNSHCFDENSGKTSLVADGSSIEECPVTSESIRTTCTTCTTLLEKVTDFVQTVWKDRCQRLDNLLNNLNRNDVRIFKCKVHIQRTISSKPRDYIHISQKVIEILDKINKISEDWVARKSEVPKIINYFKTNSSIFCDVYMKAAAYALSTHLHETNENIKCLNVQNIRKSNESKITEAFQSSHKPLEIVMVPDALHICETLEENENFISQPSKSRRINPKMSSNYILSKDQENNSVNSSNSNVEFNYQLPSTSSNNSCLYQTTVHDDRKLFLTSKFDQESRSTSSVQSFCARNIYFDPLKRMKQKITEYINHNASFSCITGYTSGSTMNPNSPLLRPVSAQEISEITKFVHVKETSKVPFVQAENAQTIRCGSAKYSSTDEEAVNYIMKDFYNRITFICQENIKEIDIYFDEKLSYNEVCKQHLSECIQLIWCDESFLSICDKLP